MKIRKILCGILAGVLICTGNPVISQGKVQAQLQVVRSKTMTVTLEASGGRMVKKASVAGTVTLPSDRNGSDYTFLGWSTKRGRPETHSIRHMRPSRLPEICICIR